MEWLLIIIAIGTGPSSISAPGLPTFKSEAACTAAMKELQAYRLMHFKARAAGRSPPSEFDLITICAPR